MACAYPESLIVSSDKKGQAKISLFLLFLFLLLFFLALLSHENPLCHPPQDVKMSGDDWHETRAPGTEEAAPEPLPVIIKELNSISKQTEALEILQQITRIEKRTFPTSEALPFGAELWRKKPNTSVIYAELQREEDQGGEDQQGQAEKKRQKKKKGVMVKDKDKDRKTTAREQAGRVIGYAVTVCMRDTVLLHKLCVVEGFRGRGLGRLMVQQVIAQRQAQGPGRVVLWVDEARRAARRVYEYSGFEEIERVEDYYGPGRRGIKMQLVV